MVPHRLRALSLVGCLLVLTPACKSSGEGEGSDAGGNLGVSNPDAGGSAGDETDAASGTASGDAATGGPSMSDAALDSGVDAEAGASPDPCASARFCENFEGYEAGAPPTSNWKVETNLGTVSVVTDQHFDGQKSARFTTQSSSGDKTAYLRLNVASVFPVPGNAYYGRMMTRLESAPDQSVHWTFIQAGGLVPGQDYHALYRYGGQQPVTADGGFVGSQLMANYDTPDSYSGTGPSSDCWNHAKGTVAPVGRWACVEWEFDGPNSSMHFWLDGVAVDSLTVAGLGQGCVHQPQTFPWTAPEFSTLELGWESYQGDSARTLYLDDIVISTERVGCPSVP